MSPQRLHRLGRRISAVFAITAVLYALLGGLIVYQASAQQTLSSVFPTLNKPHVRVPTGSDDKSVNAFFDYNALRHVATLDETYINNGYYWGTMYLIIGMILISVYFLAFAWFAKVRKGGDLYPVEVYNAYLAERGGPVDAFNWVVYAILLSYMVVYSVINIIGGQYY
jgi:hypothetical protein